MRPTLRKVRLRAVWLIVLPFFVFAEPIPSSLAVGGALALCGLALRAWAAGTIHKDEHLTVSGPYAYTRHPLYLGSLVLGLGVTTAGGSWVWPLLFLAFFATVYGRTMREETQRLGELFPADFPAYRAAVPAFVPGLRRYGTDRETRAPFLWSQYARNREWEAALGTVGALALLGVKWWLAA